MPSRDRPPSRSLRTRVAMAAALVAALVGLVAAGVAAFLVGELDMAAQDQRLSDSASLMQHELDAEGSEPRAHIEAEATEIAPVGLRIALFRNGTRIAGAEDIPSPDREGCESRTDAAGRWRTCAVGGVARRVAVSTHRAQENGRRGVLVLSVAAAALLAALVSALVSRAMAGWALRPLTTLGEHIEKITDQTPEDADLGEPSTTTEVEALRSTIRGLLGRLGEAIEQSRGFAASAAHELRTPLATMMAELELASEMSPEVAGSLTRVRRTVGRLSVLVERLLMGASGRGTLAMEAVALEDVVREVLAARSEAERTRLAPVFDANGVVRGDEALLRIVVDNLVDNALKFAPAGEVSIVVTETAGQVLLTVTDEGPGIDPAEADRLLLAFTRGTRGNESASVPGHGLGLSIVAHAVRIHGGDVRFVTRETGAAVVGAELRVTLPAWTTAGTGSEAARGSSPSTRRGHPG